MSKALKYSLVLIGKVCVLTKFVRRPVARVRMGGGLSPTPKIRAPSPELEPRAPHLHYCHHKNLEPLTNSFSPSTELTTGLSV